LAADLDALDTLPAWQCNSRRREGNPIPFVHIGRPAHYGHRLSTSGDMTDYQVIGPWVWLDAKDLGNADKLIPLLTYRLDFEPRHRQSLGETRKREVNRHELTKPVQRDFHLK
jgi:hypothetical protein